MAAEPLLHVKGLTAGFAAGPVLFGIDVDIAQGELVALVGANGAGKSTLLGTLSGLVRASAGRIAFSGRDITNQRPEAIARAQDALLWRLPHSHISVARRYTSVPLLALEIDATALAALEAMPELVVSVKPDRRSKTQ